MSNENMTYENQNGVPVDDGHTIADMSGIGDRIKAAEESLSGRDFASELQDAEERWAVILGTVKAALSVGAVYVIAFGILIALLIWLWT